MGVLMLVAILFVSCDKKPEPAISCANCTDDAFYGLPVEKFLRGVSRYNKTHVDDIKKNRQFPKDKMPSRSCWYSLDTLKKYICLIEKYSKELNIPTSELGIRFHYAVYENDGPRMMNDNYASLHTLFMVPTIQVRGIPEDFDPRLSKSFGSTSLNETGKSAFKDVYSELPRGFLRIADLKMEDTVLALGGVLEAEQRDAVGKNQGQLCPPTCPGTTNATMARADVAFPYVDYQH